MQPDGDAIRLRFFGVGRVMLMCTPYTQRRHDR